MIKFKQFNEATVGKYVDRVRDIYFQHRSLEDRAKYKRDKEARAKHKAGAAKASALLDKMRTKQAAANADKPKPTQDAPRNYGPAIAKDYSDYEARTGRSARD